MPSLRQVGVDTVYADTPCVSGRDCTAAEQINGSVKEKKNPAAKRNAANLKESTTSNAMPKMKKARRSILERLNYDGEEEDDEEGMAESNDDSPSRDKENTLNAEKKDKTKKKKIKKEGPSKKKSFAASAKTSTDKTSAKKRTIRDFYSLSPKADTSITPLGNLLDRTDASATTPTPKKATTKSVALNKNAKPLVIHVPSIERDKYASMAIQQHCVESKYEVDESPVVLTGKYHYCMKVPIERFLEGFGRYIH